MAGLIEKFIGDLAVDAVKAEAKSLVASWVKAGYIEPTKTAELETGVVDFAEVVLGMIDKGSGH